MQNVTIQYSTLAFEIKRFLKARHFVRIHDKKKLRRKHTCSHYLRISSYNFQSDSSAIWTPILQ